MGDDDERGDAMSLTKDLESKLHEYMLRMHALEKHVLRQLDLTINATNDQQLLGILRNHRSETKEHIARLEARFDVHNIEPSDLRDAGAQFAGFFKALANMVGEDKPAKHAMDAYVTEHLEIATYDLLERLALRAGDPETARVAAQNRAEEGAMASAICTNWDRVVDDMLAEERLLEQVTGPGESG
jgi:ferritin-like metal-binding protein YciE